MNISASIIAKTAEFVRGELLEAEGGHDWWHTQRVWNLAKQIARTENVDLFTVELGALLHDVADTKFHNGNEEIGPQKAAEFLHSLKVDENVISHIKNIIANISYKGGHTKQEFKSPELDVVQDADRLDAMGAIGIARAFNYGGYKNREIYNPEIAPCLTMSREQYMSNKGPTINHFYEKLLLIIDLMNTTKGKKMAQHRHQFMVTYLEEFYSEWEGRL